MKTLSTVKQLRPLFLGVAGALCALPAHADLNYADQPLFNASGTKPNVALMIDDSGSMADGDAGGSYPYVSVCSGATINYNTYTTASPDAGRGDDGCGGGNNRTSNNDTDCNDTLERNMSSSSQLDRLEAAQQAACQVVKDNVNNMRIGLFSFLSGTDGEFMQAFGSTMPTLNNSIYAMTHGSGTPLSSTMRVIANQYVGASSPLQYRCQKNYIVFFTDGQPGAGIDRDVTFTWPSLGSTEQQSPWGGSTMSTGDDTGSPGWDGYPDPVYPGASGNDVYPHLDDLAQMLYDIDLKTETSSSPTAICPDGTTPVVGKDCAGKSWDGSDDKDPNRFKQQNVITYTLGMGDEANNSLLRNTPLVNRKTISPTDVNVTADTIRVVAHGLKTGDFVHYYQLITKPDYSITATADVPTNVLTGDTTGMTTGAQLTYSANAGAGLQYSAITTPAVSAATCGAIGGLTSGSIYYVDRDSSTAFYLSSSAGNAFSGNDLNLSSRGVDGTLHSFERLAHEVTASGVTTTSNNEYISRNDHGFATGTPVVYTTSGGAIGGLTNGATYYVARISADRFRLATTASRADTCDNYANGNSNVATYCINLTSTGSGTHTFTAAATGTFSFTATGSGSSPVDSSNELINAGTHGFITGDRVRYTCTDRAYVPPVYSSINIPATVYAIVDTVGNPGTFRLALSSADASSNIAMDISAAGNPAQTFDWTTTVTQPTIGGLYAYETDAVTDATPTPATEASARGKYYVDVVDADTIRLRQCGTVSDCTTPATSTVNITSQGYGFLSTGPGRSYFASSSAQLAASLRSAFTEISGAQQSFTSLAANSGTVSTSARVYQATYSTVDWSGDVRALRFVGQGLDTVNPAWIASAELASQAPTFATRNVKTIGASGSAIDFTTGNVGLLTAAQRQSLSGNGTTTDTNVLRWIRGETVSGLRTRTSNILGDIINSSLLFVGQPSENFGTDLPASPPGCTGTVCTGQDTYNDFKAQVRPHVVYAGGNDGMLHAFNADLDPFTEGSEMLGFIPHGVYTDWVDLDNDGIQDVGETSLYKFHELAQPYYGVVLSQPHRFFVNGPMETGDAFFATAKAGLAAGSWHTVLVGGLGKGGRSMYALDITDGDNFTNNNTFLWEFTDNNSGRMGYTYSKAVIARLGTGSGGTTEGQWVAIFGNGYDSSGDEARLFIVNLETGAKLYEIHLDDPGSIGNNGLSSVSLLRDEKDIDGDGDKVEALAVYAGDLQGNVWKVPLNGAGVPGFTIPTTVSTPFFVATEAPGDGTGRRQIITTQIILQQYAELDALDGGAKEGGLMLFFGTGSYFRSQDQNYSYNSLDPSSGPKYNTMYGIWDKGDVSNVTIGQLQEQKTTLEITDVDGDGDLDSVVKSTANQPDYSDAFSPQRGWFRKLAFPDQNIYQGESLVFAPTPFDTYLIYNTVIPAKADPCESGGGGARYRVDALTGGASTYSPYDFDGDGDNEDEDASITGVIDNDVIYTESKVFEDPSDPEHFIDCAGGNDQSASCQLLKKQKKPPSAAANIKSGRMTWRQLQ